MGLALEREAALSQKGGGGALAPLFDSGAGTGTGAATAGRAIGNLSFSSTASNDTSNSNSNSNSADGCRVFLQTAPGIKFLAQVPRILGTIHLPALLHFLHAHFSDMPALASWLQNSLGGVVLLDHLEVARMVLERCGKYLLMPGLRVEISLQLKVTAVNSELLVRILSDCDDEEGEGAGAGDEAASAAGAAESGTGPPAALRLDAFLSLHDLWQDGQDIAKGIKESRVERDKGGEKEQRG